MNRCIIVGNLTRDPELSQTQSGTAVCRFSVAVNRPFTNANGEREADFINVTAWRAQAENCAKYLCKGSKVSVCGSIQTSSYEDRNGDRRFRTDLVADEVEFLSKPKEDAAPQETPPPKKKTMQELQPINDNDLPF